MTKSGAIIARNRLSLLRLPAPRGRIIQPPGIWRAPGRARASPPVDLLQLPELQPRDLPPRPRRRRDRRNRPIEEVHGRRITPRVARIRGVTWLADASSSDLISRRTASILSAS